MTQRKRRLKSQVRHLKTKRDVGFPVDQQWSANASGRKAIDAHDPLFIPKFDDLTDDDIQGLERIAGLKIPYGKRERLLLDIDCAFDVLAIYMHKAGGPPPHEVRDRMELVRDDAFKLLNRVGLKPGIMDVKGWYPTALDLNRNVLAELEEAANGDRELIFSCVKAIGALAEIADRARCAALSRIEDGWSVAAARLAFSKMLLDAYLTAFEEAPTETRNGRWHRFAAWAFKRAGLPLGSDGPRDLLRVLKQNNAKMEQARPTSGPPSVRPK